MIGKVLQFQDLQELCRPGERPRLATVERWARDCGIRIQYDGEGGYLDNDGCSQPVTWARHRRAKQRKIQSIRSALSPRSEN